MRLARTYISTFLCCGALLLGGCGTASETGADGSHASAMLDLFPPSVVKVPPGDQGETVLSSVYTPSGSLWARHLDEQAVFNMEMKHVQEAHNRYALRVGKGGQVYSLRGPFGEGIPPQGVGNPWNDEVWQFVAVCSRYNGSAGMPEEAVERLRDSGYSGTYFIHNSGAYMPVLLDSGVLTLSLDVMLDAELPGQLGIMLRDKSRADFALLGVDSNGVHFNGEQVAGSFPGRWQRMELSFEVGGTNAATVALSVRGADGHLSTVTRPSRTTHIGSLFMLVLSAGAESPGMMYLDNLVVKRAVGGNVEYPVQMDFEREMPLDIVGADREKGAYVRLTDKQAASGKRSLAMRDAPGLEHGWQPMMRVFPKTTRIKSFYCPLLADDAPVDGRTYRMLNWGIIPQLKTIHRSPILYYVQTRDLGNGIIEVTYVVHNFSTRDDIVFDHLNAPWGGTRMSSLPFHYLSSPDGELRDRAWMTSKNARGKNVADAMDVRSTGGWNLSSSGESPDSPSLALVFGRDKHLEAENAKRAAGKPYCQFSPSIYRHMIGQPLPEDWRTRPENSWRNYEVAVVIPKFRLAPGTTIWYRIYLVVNRRERAIELAKSLVDKVDYGLLTFDPAITPKVPVFIRDGEVVEQDDAPAFELYARPIPGTMPLLLVENATNGLQVITTDPYIFVPQEKLDLGVPEGRPELDYYREAVGYSMDEHNSRWIRLLGYGFVDEPAGSAHSPLSSVTDRKMFPTPTHFHLDLWVVNGEGQ